MATNRIRSLFCDLHGLPRGKYVPPAVADGGRIGFAMAVFAVSLDRDLVTVPGTSVQEGLPDMELVLDGERRRSWQEGTETFPWLPSGRGNSARTLRAFGAEARRRWVRSLGPFAKYRNRA